MSVVLNPYIHFKGDAKEAMTFYQSVLGGDLTLSTFGEAGAPVEASEADLIMHAQLTTPVGITLMGSDTPSHIERTPGNTMTVSLSGDSEDELSGYWTKLAEGATITQPLEKAPWGDSFGMLVDQYGVGWLVNISGSAN